MTEYNKKRQNSRRPALSVGKYLSGSLIWELLEEVLGKSFDRNRELIDSVLALSELFTSERAILAKTSYFQKRPLRDAYLAYFLPLNYFKVVSVLTAHKDAWLKPSGKAELRVLDYGCGPATATLAFLSMLPTETKKLTVTLVDTQPGALQMAKGLLEKISTLKEIDIEIETLSELPKEADGYDLVFASNILNELETGEEIYANLWKLCDGFFLSLEPSHRVASQKLIRARERLRKENDLDVVGPCMHREACPLLRTQHWCHFSVPLTDVRMIELNFRIFKDPRKWLKFSYVMMQKKSVLKTAGRAEYYRAIGDLHLSGPGHLAVDLCTPGEKRVARFPMRALDRVLQRKLIRGALVKMDHNAPSHVLSFGERRVRPATHAFRRK